MSGRPTHLVVLAAGGTGGHVFPAEALGSELLRRSCPLALFTDKRGASFGALTEQIDIHTVRAGRFSGGFMERACGLANLARGVFEAGRKLRRLRPAVAVGFGGYSSVPTMIAAICLGIPTLIHEQNAVLGRANRLLALRAAAIATSFERVARLRPADLGKATCTGNPVRAAVAAIRDEPYAPVEERLTILIIGGSQGATVFSRVLPDALALMPEGRRRRLMISQQCRPEDIARVEEAYTAMGMRADIKTFFNDVPTRLHDAHLVIARAGASTVAEITAAGRPAVLVPYPHATEDHQTANARAVEEAGAAWVFAEPAFTGHALAQLVERFLLHPELLAEAAAAARAMGIPNAASRLANKTMELLPSDGEEERPGKDAEEAA